MKIWIIFGFCVGGILCSVQGQTANNEFYIASAGAPFSVSAPGVLTNDTGGSLTAVLAGGPANGTLTLNPNGSFVYTPTNNFTGMDGFTYQAVSGGQTSRVASVDIMVVAPGEMFYDNFTRPQASGSGFPWLQESGTWGITNNLMIGTCLYSNYGYAYFPDNHWTNYSVQAQIRFSSDNASSAGIAGRLNPTTGAHYAVWIYPEHSPEFLASSNGTAVLRLIKYPNWSYPYTLVGNALPLPGVGVGWHTVKMTFQNSNIFVYFDGHLVTNVTDDGSIDRTPAYTNGGIALNMWSLPPTAYAFSVDNVIVSSNTTVANYDSYVATSNITLNVAAPGVLANDSGNGTLTATLVGGPAHGDLILTNNGGFSYTPTNNFMGTDRFTYRCTDGQTTSGVTTVTITVNNSAFANNDAYSMPTNVTLNVAAPGVLANDQGGNAPLTAVLATGPADGSLTLTNNGGFSYTPGTNFEGQDSFSYLATDGQTTSGVATVTITVIPAPTANNDFYTTQSGATLNVPAPGVLLNDANVNGNATAILVSNPLHGSLSWGGDGSFSYQASSNYTGMDSFTYQAADADGTSSVATVDIMVAPADAFFFDNFARPSGFDSLYPWVVESGTWSITNNQMIGTSPVNSYGLVYYENTNWTDYVVQAQVRLSSTNAWGGAIGGRLDPATGAHYDLWIYPENSPWGPQNGSPAGTATLQIIKYETWTSYTAQQLVELPGVGTNWHTIKLAFAGSNLFAYFDGNQITNLTDDGSFDGQPAYTRGGICASLWTQSPTTFLYSLSNVEVAPLVVNNSYSVNENSKLTVSSPGMLSGDTAVYGSNLAATLVSGPADGALNLNTNGGFNYTPAVNFTGTDAFTCQVTDQSQSLGLAKVTIAVVPAGNPEPAPEILSIDVTNGIATITWSSVTNLTYEVQYTDDLGSTNWSNVLPEVTATGPTSNETNVIGNTPQEFYRVALLPP